MSRHVGLLANEPPGGGRVVLHLVIRRPPIVRFGSGGRKGLPPCFYREDSPSGPSGDVKWDEADPTYSVEAAKREGK